MVECHTQSLMEVTMYLEVVLYLVLYYRTIIYAFIMQTETPDMLKDLQVEEECYNEITLQWNSLGDVGTIFLDEYILYVSPNPDYGDCENGICWFNNTSSVVDGLQDGVEYEFSVSGVNCAGIGNSDAKMQLITAEGMCLYQ